jgi:hypothetical protein
VTPCRARRPLVLIEHMTRAILRSHGVMLDEVRAELYGVGIKVLLQAVRRNLARFPKEFMFQFTTSQWAALR